MKVSECMNRDLRLADPADSIQQAAQSMAEGDVGFLPVTDHDRLIGIVTDRDIAIRGVGCGCSPETSVEEVMSYEVQCCSVDQDAADVLRTMSDLQVRRLPVVDKERNLVGIVSISDLAAEEGRRTGEALSVIAQPSSQHSQSL